MGLIIDLFAGGGGTSLGSSPGVEELFRSCKSLPMLIP